MKINFAPHKTYSEISQTSQTKFSFIKKISNDEYTELFSPVKCRDFLGDVVYATKTNNLASIYLFEFNPNLQKIDKDATRLLIMTPSITEFNNIKANWFTLNAIEKKNKMKLSTYKEHLKDDKFYLIVEGSKIWQQTIWLISLYSFLLRALGYHTFASGGNESTYKSQIGKHWKTMLNNIKKIWNRNKDLSGWGENVNDIGQLHNCSGFVSLFREHTYQDRASNIYYNNFKTLCETKNNA